ncbi:MAG: hypothetical protein AVDCRST_MAG77-4744 [uncultured Chloroflexi bacterium]|uniref:Tyr recombinase domain-containing protein n=1 Tax=uncultured Chloroflexota bacterium TaxID=166587 RepID=A0A6J4JYW5_9CHLR|nr:MAG: hypothetical protein AVDCRST_MAG77-4744 [uncultured Chloroflexota bacterium]
MVKSTTSANVDDPAPGASGFGRRTRRRGAGEGSVYFDAKMGLWRASLMVGRKPNGKPDRRLVSAKTQKLCQQKLQELRQQFLTDALADPNKLTVQAFFEDWLEHTVKVRRRASTYSQYKSLITVHVYPSLGKTPLRAVRPGQVEDLYRALEAGGRNPKYVRRDKPAATQKGLAPKTIRGLHIALHSGFERARRRNLIARNPADGIELPKAPRRKKLTVDVEDIQRLLATTDPNGGRWVPLWTFLANTGLRIGEALALRWANVDLDKGWFTVEETRQRPVDGKAGLDNAKTEAGMRDVPLTAPALKALRAQHDRQRFERERLRDDYVDQDLVFATSLGTPLGQRNALRALKAAVEAAKLPANLCLHDLRRMTASLLVASGVDITTAAAILGHKNASVLLDVYAQALKAPKLEAAGRLERALYGAG